MESILIQRKVVGIVVKLQTAVILTALYRFVPKPNTWVASWEPDAYVQAMTYIVIDLLVDGLVFGVNVAVLHCASSEITSPWRIVRGAVHMHFSFFYCMLSFAWAWSLINQSVVGGSDFSLQFSWVGMNASSTDAVQWCGGFDWTKTGEGNCGGL